MTLRPGFTKSFNPHVWYTCKKEAYDPLRVSDVPRKEDKIVAVYAIFLVWPVDDVLRLQDLTEYIKSKDYHVDLLRHQDYTALNVSTCK